MRPRGAWNSPSVGRTYPMPAAAAAPLPPSIQHLSWLTRAQTQPATVRLPFNTLDRLDALASRIGCDRSELIRTALRQWLDGLDEGSPAD